MINKCYIIYWRSHCSYSDKLSFLQHWTFGKLLSDYNFWWVTLVEHLSSGEVAIIKTNFKEVTWNSSLRLIFKEKVRLIVKKTSNTNVGIQVTMCLLMFCKINILSTWLTSLPLEDVRDPSVPIPLSSEDGHGSLNHFPDKCPGLVYKLMQNRSPVASLIILSLRQ